MSKLLNKLGKSSSMGVNPAVALRPGIHELSIPRVALGVAGAAMTAITIAVSVILPAQMDSGNRAARMLAVSKATAPAPVGPAMVTRIDVVGKREAKSIAVGVAPWQPEQPGETLAVIRVSSTDR
jgi:hypothetical protein